MSPRPPFNGHPLGFALGALAMSVTLLVLSCAASIRASSYADEGLACVEENATRTAADACRCQVETKYDQPRTHCAARVNDAGEDRTP